MSLTMRSSFQSCTNSEEPYCAPWDLKIQEERLKYLNQQHHISSFNTNTIETDTLLHSSNINNQSSFLSFNHTNTNTPLHRAYSVRTPSKKQSCTPILSVLTPLSPRDLIASRQSSTGTNNSIIKTVDPTLKKISNTIRSGTATSRSFLFTSSSSPQKMDTTIIKHDCLPMSFEAALFRFKCLSSSIYNNSLPKTPTSYEQSPTCYLNNHHGRSLQKLSNTEETNRHCLSPTFSSCRQSEDMTIDRYFWYHYAMSRRQAENILESRSSGSFLVRQSESGNQNDYSLSIKTIQGCMHMRICYSRGFYILGECSRPFSSIACMIKYFSHTSVPIRGAAHIKLGTPVLRYELLPSSLSNEELL